MMVRQITEITDVIVIISFDFVFVFVSFLNFVDVCIRTKHFIVYFS